MISDFSQWITYLITLIFTFFGVYAGVFLAFISPEELKAGKRYFKGMMHTVTAVAFTVLTYFYTNSMMIAVLLGLVILVTLYFLPHEGIIDQIVYYMLGVMFFFSAKYPELFMSTSALIFLYGLPLGSNYVEENPKQSKTTQMSNVFLKYGAFVVIGLLTNLVYLYMVRII